MYHETFMAYSILHESWLNYVNDDNDGGSKAKGISNTKSRLGFWNYRHEGKIMSLVMDRVVE